MIDLSLSETGEMEQELQKRNTDCVYFLASPLTCKKGLECEYRHNDIARLNPRDCWYWLAGNCLNPACGFRHPPLESFPDPKYKSTSESHVLAEPLVKTNVPCFFYYNGFCNKGEKCVFLHGPGDGAPAWQSSKVASGVTDGPAPAPDKKALGGTKTASVTVETLPGSCPEIAAIGNMNPQVNLYQATNDLTEGKSSQGGISGSSSQGDDDSEKELKSSPHTLDSFNEGGSQLATALSSDDETVVEGLELSPGFDVLVNDRSDELVYKEGNEYLFQSNNYARHLDEGQYVEEYDFDDKIEYTSVNIEEGIALEEESHDAYIECSADYYFRKPYSNAGSIDEGMESIFHQKRKMKLRDWGGFTSNGVDLHHHHHHYPRSHGLSSLNASSRRNRHLKLDGTLRPIRKMRSRSDARFKRRGGKQLPPPPPPWLHQASQIRASPGKRKSTRNFRLFSAPKALSQIKEEKKRANGDASLGTRAAGVEDDFQGPKSLAEILRGKRR